MQRIDLLNPKFSKTLRGYNPDEVNEFLQDITDTMARMSDERVRLMNHIGRLEERLANYIEQENSMRETMMASQKVNEGIRIQSQKEAQLVIEAAHTKAESITTQANIRLAKLLDEIAEARKLKAQFEFKVRSVIEGHLKLLEIGQAEDARIEKAAAALSTPAPLSASRPRLPSADSAINLAANRTPNQAEQPHAPLSSQEDDYSGLPFVIEDSFKERGNG